MALSFPQVPKARFSFAFQGRTIYITGGGYDGTYIKNGDWEHYDDCCTLWSRKGSMVWRLDYQPQYNPGTRGPQDRAEWRAEIENFDASQQGGYSHLVRFVKRARAHVVETVLHGAV